MMDSNTDGSFTRFELVFESLSNSFDSSRKQIFRNISGKFSHFITCMYVVCAHQNRLIDAILMGILYQYTQNVAQ